MYLRDEGNKRRAQKDSWFDCLTLHGTPSCKTCQDLEDSERISWKKKWCKNQDKQKVEKDWGRWEKKKKKMPGVKDPKLNQSPNCICHSDNIIRRRKSERGRGGGGGGAEEEEEEERLMLLSSSLLWWSPHVSYKSTLNKFDSMWVRTHDRRFCCPQFQPAKPWNAGKKTRTGLKF